MRYGGAVEISSWPQFSRDKTIRIELLNATEETYSLQGNNPHSAQGTRYIAYHFPALPEYLSLYINTVGVFGQTTSFV